MSRMTEYFKKEKKKLIRFIAGKLKKISHMDPEDILQDVFCKIISCGYDDDDIQNIDSFVFRSLKNRVVDIYRKPYNEVSANQMIEGTDSDLLSTLRDKGSSTGELLENKELADTIFNAVSLLPEEQKVIWIASEIDYKTVAEIAEEFDIPPGTVLSRKYRANKKLKKLLDQADL